MNITLKDVPKKLHTQLKKAAKASGRSLNTEAIAALERQYLPVRIDPHEQLRLIRETQLRYPVKRSLNARELKAAIEEGRE
jgi:hypothetical protein